MYTYADVILPLPLQGTFTYKVPATMQSVVQPGMRVLVNFGRSKLYAGIIKYLHNTPPTYTGIKEIVNMPDERPMVTAQQLQFWQWVALYYMCTIGEVMAAAMPSVFRLSSETKIIFHPDYDGDITNLTPQELAVIGLLNEKQEVTFKELHALLGNNYAMRQIQNMIDKDILILCEDVEDRYKPKQESGFALAPEYAGNNEALSLLLADMEKNKKTQLQADTLLLYMQCARKQNTEVVKKSELMSVQGITDTRLNALVKKGVLQKVVVQTSRWQYQAGSMKVEDILLSPAQNEAYNQIQQKLQEWHKLLFHGVTGSGKTEIYIKLIQSYIEQGKQVLYLLPEIALTEQIINRLRTYFGDMVGIYHSQYNYMQRAEVWQEMCKENGRFKVILGTRSALFMPFTHPGLIIVDEEHDVSYKQFDPAPRYHARDAAVMLAEQVKADIVLGTATPCMESMNNVFRGKYAYVTLMERYGGVQLPQVKIVNMRAAKAEQQMEGHFSFMMYQHIEHALQQHKQVILFQNRRGYAPHMECPQCGHIPHCRHCDVTLTYHKKVKGLQCHYCGYITPVINVCPQCGTAMQMKGFGTEMVEEELQARFPQANIARLDYDSTRNKNAHKRILSEFEQQHTDILIGTQMVTKGLDFDNVSLVGILNADNMLNYPDFRSYERALQLLMQVSGRAGRKKEQGLVLIQTYDPRHSIFSHVQTNDYARIAEILLAERKQFGYPPYTRLVKIGVQHKQDNVAMEAALALVRILQQNMDIPVLGPENSLVARVKNLYRKEIMLKMPLDGKIPARKQCICNAINDIKAMRNFSQVIFVPDVDVY